MFDILAKFGIDGTGFEGGLKRAEEQLHEGAERMSGTLERVFANNGLGGMFTNLAGAAGFGGLIALASEAGHQITEKFSAIHFGAESLGLDEDMFQRLRNVVSFTGESTETVRKFFEMVAVQQDKVKNGGMGAGQAMKHFAALGQDAATVAGLSFQELALKIMEFVHGTGELSGEQIAALHGLGKQAVKLIPAMKEGLEGPIADKGTLDRDEMEAMERLHRTQAEQGQVTAEMWNRAGLLWERVWTGLKATPAAFEHIASTILHPFSARDDIEASRDRVHMLEQQKEIEEKDAERRKKDAEDAKRAETEKINAEFTRKQQEENQAKAIKDLDRLEPELAKKEKQNAFEKLSADEKKKFLTEEANKEKEISALYEDRFRQNPEDATLRREAVGHKLLQLDAEKQLHALEQHHAQPLFHVEDRLARIGGGFQDADGGKALRFHERTANNTDEIVRNLRDHPNNPLSGS